MSEVPAPRSTTAELHGAAHHAVHPAPGEPMSVAVDCNTAQNSRSLLSRQFRAQIVRPEAMAADHCEGHAQHDALRIETDLAPSTPASSSREAYRCLSHGASSTQLEAKSSTHNLQPIARTPSLKAALSHSLGSANGSSSSLPSPIITAMGDVTPLPSPLMTGDSPGPWHKLNHGALSPLQHREKLKTLGGHSVLVTSTGESVDAALANASKRKHYASLEGSHTPTVPPTAVTGQSQAQHTRNRSVSDYAADSSLPAIRQITVSGSQISIDTAQAKEPHMKREQNFAESRGLTPTVVQPPTPPPSESSKDSIDGGSQPKSPSSEYFVARDRQDLKRRWKAVRSLGQGTFSQVMLATSQSAASGSDNGAGGDAVTDYRLDPKTLVAVKVCEAGPKGGASEDRVEMSLKRELEILQSIHHPSLVDLKAWSIEPTRAILILGYCPGGDLFDVATAHRSTLNPFLLRRIFTELVGAVRYLHERNIVHRDIKLENVLVNLTADELGSEELDWATYPYSVVTLTDLGLSRRVADDEKLETRCGSEDYAAPEVIMGQPYDGRATDAWSLGVLLYALLEARLPFDPHPGMTETHRMRSRTSHRIARVEWHWVEYSGNDGDHDASVAKFDQNDLLGAMEVTEGLLKRARSRWTLGEVADHPWVKNAIQVNGGIQFRPVEEGQEVL